MEYQGEGDQMIRLSDNKGGIFEYIQKSDWTNTENGMHSFTPQSMRGSRNDLEVESFT